ncbi:nucleotidyltransferase domain-containing protein [Paraliomyxa miuraensis]|uniref:nucleotidyltransferase domain-containing protein n=1 Tax=Paraliomyxa miuraensis TaxID=376150 RepID=UPI00224D9C84|nr:nucleotidyltransferase domain-containing protein [Paraliomyxa miuraensis]MCX4246584.1 nucleotidyltransferase domain-containing protein [Paraliomyxa miuraensis]
MESKQLPSVMGKLPSVVAAKLEALRDSLVQALGEDLQALVVYGSAVRGGYVDGRSDVDLLVVVRDDGRAKLEAIGNALLLARTSARIESMILRGDELQKAADVFPLLYDDVRSRHVLLHGEDPFAALEISDAHRRLRVEQELREARIRLRLLLSEAPMLPRQLPGAVARKIKQLRSPLHALLRLRGREVDDGIEPVMREACSLYEADAGALLRFEEAPQAAYDVLTGLLDAAIADVDVLEV